MFVETVLLGTVEAYYRFADFQWPAAITETARVSVVYSRGYEVLVHDAVSLRKRLLFLWLVGIAATLTADDLMNEEPKPPPDGPAVVHH